MEKFAIDIQKLEQRLEGKKGKSVRMEKTAEAISRLRKVAQGLYSDDSEAGFWRVEKDVDGTEWLTRMEEAEVEAPGWTAEESNECEAVTLSFKGSPIHKFDAKFYGFDKQTVGIFKKTLMKKLTSADFRRQILSAVPAEELLRLNRKLNK